MFFWRKKTNCWEFNKCGREPGGRKVNDLGICPATQDKAFNRLNGGANGGRVCWAVAGTHCGGTIRGDCKEKQADCIQCDFFKQLVKEEGRSLKLGKPGQSDTGSIISAPKVIADLMHRAHQSNLLFNASIEGHPEKFVTSLLGVYPQSHLLVFDQLNSSIGHKLLLKQKEMHLIGRLHGAELQCSIELAGTLSKSGTQAYKMKMPESAYYLQLRQAHRISLYGERLPIDAYSASTKQWFRGYLINLSTGGIGAIVENGENLEMGDILEPCKITLPGNDCIRTPLRVRFIKHNKARGNARIGCCFYDLSDAAEDRIHKYIVRTQRRQAKLLR